MKLNFIETDKCPICGCDIVIEESIETETGRMGIRVHTNGGRWEHRKFLCGKEIIYCPNFRREELKGNCKRAPIYKTTFFIYERNILGDYSGVEPYEYRLETTEMPTNEDFKDIIFQACEIERIPNVIISVDINTEKDGEFVNHDEFEFTLNIVRTQKLSKYICWDKCPNFPPIYEVDKEKSEIKLII